jgi:antitoxin component of MazEF toxin-antitoxin module
MRKKLTKLGSSLAILLDKPLLHRLGLDEYMEVDMDVLGQSLMITPVRSFEDDWNAALAARLQQVWLRLGSENARLASPEVVAECENLQRLITYHLGGAEVPEHCDPALVANETTFRPGRTCERAIVEQFIGRSLSALRYLNANETPPDESDPPAMTRTQFMDWTEALLIRKLNVPSVRREGDNNVQNAFHDDVHIGIVATTRATATHSGPCIRVHIWTYDAARGARWEKGATLAGPCPQGVVLASRGGDRGNIRYLEFSWANDDLEAFQRWLTRVEKCVDFFVAARTAHRVP